MANSVLEALTWVPLTRGSAPAHSPPCTGCSSQTRCSSAAAHLAGWHLPKHIPIYLKQNSNFWYHCTILRNTQIPWFLAYLPYRVADTGCWFIPDHGLSGSKTFRIPCPGSGSASNLSIFNPKNCFYALGNMIRDVPGSGSRLFTHPGSRGHKGPGSRDQKGPGSRDQKGPGSRIWIRNTDRNSS